MPAPLPKADSTQRLSIWYILFPGITMILAFPMIASLPPFNIGLIRNQNLYQNFFQISIVTPLYLGIAAIPGYLFAWAGNYNATILTPLVRKWVYLSLLCAFISSVGGLISIFTIIIFPFDVASVLLSFKLLMRFRESYTIK